MRTVSSSLTWLPSVKNKPVSSQLSVVRCPWSLERWHLELDLGELVGGLADFAQEGQPARVGVDFVEQILRYDSAESRVLVCDGLVEPLERFVGIAAERVDVGDVAGRFLLILRDQRVERGIGVGFA